MFPNISKAVPKLSLNNRLLTTDIEIENKCFVKKDMTSLSCSDAFIHINWGNFFEDINYLFHVVHSLYQSYVVDTNVPLLISYLHFHLYTLNYAALTFVTVLTHLQKKPIITL